MTFDDLAIFNRALTTPEIAQIAASPEPLRAAMTRVGGRDIRLETHALDDAGGIMSVQIGVDGVFGDPQPYSDSSQVSLPSATGSYTVAARFFDRSENSTTISATVTIATPPRPLVTNKSSQPSPSRSCHETPGPSWLSRLGKSGWRSIN